MDGFTAFPHPIRLTRSGGQPILAEAMSAHRLSALSIGETGTIHSVSGSDAITVRLMEMGLVPGTEVQLRKRGPLGDPLAFEVRGYHLSLRRAEADRVEVVCARGQP